MGDPDGCEPGCNKAGGGPRLRSATPLGEDTRGCQAGGQLGGKGLEGFSRAQDWVSWVDPRVLAETSWTPLSVAPQSL